MNTIRLIKNYKNKLIPLFLSCLKPLNSIVIFRNFFCILKGPDWEDFINKNNLTYISLIKKGILWINTSQDKVGFGGVGCYEFLRWTKGYPEVIGYIIPTFFDCFRIYDDVDLKNRVFKIELKKN